MSSPVATKAFYEFPEVVPPAQPQVLEQGKALEIVPAPPPPPKESQITKSWQRFKASPHGRAFTSLARGLGVMAPVALTAGAGYAVGSINAYEASAWFGLVLGGIAGGIGANIACDGAKSLIETYKRARHESPYAASFWNVTLYMTVPATVAGVVTSLYAGGGWGVAAAVAFGCGGAVVGMMAHDERLKDWPAP